MSSFDHSRPHSTVPESIVSKEDNAKRNILRKGGYMGNNRKEATAGRAIDDGSTYFTDPIAANEHDPNYDSEEETGFEVIPKCDEHMTLVAYKKAVEPVITEYFGSGDIDDVARSLFELGAIEYTYEFVKRLLSMALDRTDREREGASQLMSALWPNVISSNMIGKGFERLFELVQEIEKDVPAAKTMLATFLARAVIDEVLPPSFLADTVVCKIGGEVVGHAKLLLSRDHAGAKLERCWGAGDGRPAEELKLAVDQLFQEYLLSGDVDEAMRCLAELNSPLFFHEVVKRGIVNSLDCTTAKHAQMSVLFSTALQRELLSPQQARKGFDRVHGLLPDLMLDTPSAKAIVAGFVERAQADGVLQGEYVTSTATAAAAAATAPTNEL